MQIIRILALVVSLLIPGYTTAFGEEDLFDTKTAAAHLDKGLGYLKAKNYKAAIEELEESVSIDPDAEAFYYLGYSYYMRGKSGDEESRKKAIENFEKAYDLNPDFTPTRYRPEMATKPSKPKKHQSKTQELTEQDPAKAADDRALTEPASQERSTL